MKWFTLPPVVYCGIGGLIALVAIAIFFSDRSAETEKRAVLAGKPPAAVQIDKFDRARDVALGGEVMIEGQIDTAKMIDVTETKDGSVVKRWFVAPLYPVAAKTPAGLATGAIVQEGNITDPQLKSFIVSEGPFGPVMRLNGKLTEGGNAISEAAKSGVIVGPTPVYVDPFEDGRAAAFAPSNDGRDGSLLVLIAGLALIGYGLIRWVVIARENRAYA